ncbi:MAG: ATP-dependent DNA helicase PcrA [Clostridiales bacterium]|nr:ATP-dependent DNA helicase PcrA [Clostridiales bacterium]
MMFSLDTLNELQRKIAMDTEGAKLVTAGAGSGKTRLLTHRICYLIDEKKVNPFNILAITFTNKATNEMRERISGMIDNSVGITIKTFHSLCASILRENINKLDGFDRNFSVYDSSDQDKLLKKVIKELAIDEDTAKKCGYHISKAKNLGLNPDEYLKDNKYERDIDVIYKVYKEYQKQLKNNNALDFDDLLLQTLELFYASPETLRYYQDKFHYIHVDEFQDTNLVQYKLIKLISAVHGNIFVVGDEDQCIYCWRGANIENINNFIKDFNCTIYKLEQNYRSTKNIIKSANKLIKNNISRLDKTLYTENEDGEEVTYHESYDEVEEVEYVARQIYNLQSSGVDMREVGVLMRVSALSRLIEEKLLNYNIPYKVSGIFKFFERLEVKNILAYLTMFSNPRDNSSIIRIINYPKRGIGQATIDKLLEIAERDRKPLVDVVENFRDLDLSSTIKNKIAEFGDLITELKVSFEKNTLSEFVEDVVNKAGIKGLYNTNSEEDVDRTMNIDQLIQSVKSYEHLNEDANLTDYLESVTLQNSLDEEDDNLPSVSVSTVHASKGLEFDYVFIIGAEDGKFPLSRAMDSADEMEEERRLMYVAVTRAKKKLYITRAKSRFMYGKRESTIASKFVKEMGFAEEKPRISSFGSGYSGYSNSSCESNYSSYGGYSSSSSGYNSYSTYSDYTNKVNKISSSPSNNLGNLQGIMTNKLNSQKKSFDDYKVGVQVLHAKFGVGTIVKVDSGNNNYVSVDFGKLGVKTLSLNIAPLQILKK